MCSSSPDLESLLVQMSSGTFSGLFLPRSEKKLYCLCFLTFSKGLSLTGAEERSENLPLCGWKYEWLHGPRFHHKPAGRAELPGQ